MKKAKRLISIICIVCMLSQVLGGYLFAEEAVYSIEEEMTGEPESAQDAPGTAADNEYSAPEDAADLIEDTDLSEDTDLTADEGLSEDVDLTADADLYEAGGQASGEDEAAPDSKAADETESGLYSETESEPLPEVSTETSQIPNPEESLEISSEEVLASEEEEEFLVASEDLQQATLQVLDDIPGGNPVTGIDFGTIDLSQNKGKYSRDIYYKQGNTAGAPVSAGTPIFLIDHNWFDCPPQQADTAGVIFSNPRSFGNGEGFGGNSAMRDEIDLDTTTLLAGTYTAVYHVHVDPQCVDANGNLENDPQTGEILIPVRAELTGTNSLLPDQVENLRAEEGNGQVVLTWDAIDSFGACDRVYNIYRRTGEETGSDPDRYDYSLYEQIGMVSASEGTTRYIDESVENEETYSYFVMGSEPWHGYPSEAVSATPSGQAAFRPSAPELAAGPMTGAVQLDWNLPADETLYPGYPDGWADGAGVIDHFNVYRNGVIVAQVDQNACVRRPDEDRYEWILQVPCEDLSGASCQAGYTWWVTAVATDALGGRESYESERCSASPYSERPRITYSRAEWSKEDSTVTLFAGTEYSVSHMRVWRDDVYLGKKTDYSNGEYRFEDKTAKSGKTYIYRFSVVDGLGAESDPVTLTVKTQSPDFWEIESPRVLYPDNWRIRNGKTVIIDNVYVDPDAAYRILRNNETVAVYGRGGINADTISFEDTPAQPGTYIYRVDKEQDGITLSSMEYAFIKEEQGSTGIEKPLAPSLSARVAGSPGARRVQLTWAENSEGPKAEGYYIYRSDNGNINTGAFQKSDGAAEYRQAHNYLNEPAQGRYFRRLAPGNQYLDEAVSWTDSSIYPLSYWVCAYNQYGISKPSQIITYELADADGDDIPDEPANEDTQKPEAPQITDLFMRYNPDSYGVTSSNYYGYLDVSWQQPSEGGGVDSYTVTFTEPDGDRDTFTRYPGASGEDGKMTASILIYYPDGYGQYSVTVEAKNAAGETTSSAEYLVGGIPSLAVRPAQTPSGKSGASALLEWTSPYMDDVTVTGYEIWRRTQDASWENIASVPGDAVPDESSGMYAYTDCGLSDAQTYEYSVSAITDSATPERRSIERSVTVYENYALPDAPVLRQPVLANNGGSLDLLLSWEKPSAGRPTDYYLEIRKNPAGSEGEWEDWWVLNGSREPLETQKDQAGFVTDLMITIPYALWQPKEYEKDDTVSFRLQAVNGLGESEWSDPVTISPAQMTAGYTPEDMKPYYAEPAAEAGDGQVTLTWSPVPEPEGYAQVLYYRVLRYEVTTTQGTTGADWQTTYYDYNPTPKTLAQLPAGQDSYSYTDEGLDNGQLYAYHVAAYSAGGHYYNEDIEAITRMKGLVMVTPRAQIGGEADAAQTMVDSLPSVADVDPDILQDADALSQLEEQIQEVKDALSELPEDEQDQIDQSKLSDLEDYLGELKQEAGWSDDPGLKTMTLTGTTSYTRRASQGAFSLRVNCSAQDAELTYTSSNSKVARVDARGRVTPGTAGTAAIRVKAACEGYADADMTLTVTVTGLARGGSCVCGSGASRALYKVTGSDTVTYVKCKAAAASKTLSVPATVTINRASYRVTAVGSGAFSGYKKVKKLTIGANTASIGSKAFKKCKKLKTLTIQSTKLTQRGISKALSGSSVKKVKVPKSVKKAYKKIFKKNVCGRKVTVK